MNDRTDPQGRSFVPLGRPPTAMYEARTRDGVAYRAEGDVIEHGDGWFTLWSDAWTVALKIPDRDIRAIRQVPDGEDEAAEAHGPPDAALEAQVRKTLGIDTTAGEAPDIRETLAAACHELEESEATRAHLREQREEWRRKAVERGFAATRLEGRLDMVRGLHTESIGLCEECTAESGVPWPCPTIRAIDSETTSKEQP